MIDTSWDDMGFALPFDDRLLLPNESATVHEGLFELSSGSPANKITLNGRIEQCWLPTPRVRFSGVCSKPMQKSSSMHDLNLRSSCKELSFKCRISRVHEVDQGLECSGVIQGDLRSGPDAPVDEVRFSLVNFPEFCGIKVKQVDEGTGHRFSLDSIILGDAGWSLCVHQRFRVCDLLAEVRTKGGYVATHSCSLRRTDGGQITYSSSQEMLKNLTFFFAFLAGRWCGPVLAMGMSKGTLIWNSYDSHLVSPNLLGDSWFPLDYTVDIASLFSRFLTRLRSEMWSSSLRQAVDWIVTANSSQNAVETSLVAAFVPLEMLCRLILVESMEKYTTKKFKNIDSGAKISELLSADEIPNEIPSYLRSLHGAFAPDTPTASSVLVQIRNAIAHPRQAKREFLAKIGRNARRQGKELCLEIVELALLKSMGYEGRYRRRAYAGWSGEEYAYVPWVR